MLQNLKNNFAAPVAVILFLLIVSAGILLSTHKPLWSDEILTAQFSIPQHSYLDILKGKISGEANNFPLYYLVQKATMNICHFKLSQRWDESHFMFDRKGQILLRLPSNIFLALSLAYMFFFFAHQRDMFSAMTGLLLAISSYMTIAYWLEARPYALWYSLSLIHGILFLKIQKNTSRQIGALTVIHTLLALTSFIAVIQITLSSLLIFWKNRDIKKLLILCAPLAFALFYKLNGISIITPWFNVVGPSALFYTAVPPEWMAIILIGIIVFLSKKYTETKDLLIFSAFFLGLTASAIGILLIAWINKNPGPFAPALYYRHFIFLTPYAILLMTNILKSFWLFSIGHRWVRINIVLFILALILTNGLHALTLLYNQIIFIF